MIFPIDSTTIKNVSFPKPASKKTLKYFLDKIGYYRHLIPAYADTTSLLIALTSPKVNASRSIMVNSKSNQINALQDNHINDNKNSSHTSL